MMRPFVFIAVCISAIFLHGCGCGCDRGGRGPIKIGVDSNWYPLVFGAQNSYVNGFTEELLLDISKQSGLEFERIAANWDALSRG